MHGGSLTLSGSGKLSVNGDARVVFNGIPGDISEVKNAQGVVEGHDYLGFTGQAVVSGDRIDVVVAGLNLGITAKGIGKAYLVGDGRFTVVHDSDGATVDNSNWSVAPPKDLNIDWKIVAVPFGNEQNTVAVTTAPEAASSSLTAQGNGNVRVDMTAGTITIAGNGKLYVSSRATINITGTQGTLATHIDRANVVDGYYYYGFHGQAVISGDHFNVRLEGKDIDLTAQGIGNAWLIGEGSYTRVSEAESASKASGVWIAAPAKGKQLDMKRLAVRFGHHEYTRSTPATSPATSVAAPTTPAP